MNLHLNPFDKAKIKKEEEERIRKEKEIENHQLSKMLEKLNKMQKDEAKNSINAGSAQVLASSTFKGVLHEDSNMAKVEQKRFAIPDVFFKFDENPDFVIDHKKNGLDEHDFLMYSTDSNSESVVETQKKLLSELKDAQSNKSQDDIKNMLNINDSNDSVKGALNWKHSGHIDDYKTDILLQETETESNETQKNNKIPNEIVKEEKKMPEKHLNSNFIRNIKESGKNSSNNFKQEIEEKEMVFDKDKFIDNSQDYSQDYPSNKNSVNFVGSDTETISEEGNVVESLTKQWEGNLNHKLNSNIENRSSKFSYKTSTNDEVEKLQRKIDKIIAREKSQYDEDFDYDKEAFGLNDDMGINFDADSYLSKTMQEEEILREPEEVIDFFKIDENDMSFALNLIRGMDSNKTKLTTRDGLLRLLRNEPKSQQTMGIIGNRQYLQEAYLDLKNQLNSSFFIHLNLRKMYMYSSPVLFLMKHFISQLPEISVDDKKILWKRCANLLSATKFASTKYSEELIFDRELAITDPITNIKREISKVLNAYDLNEIKFIIIVDEIRGIDDEQFLNCISFLTLVFENLYNFRLVFEIDSSFIKINVKSTKLKLGLSMIDHYSAQSKVLIGSNLSSYNKNENKYTRQKELNSNSDREAYTRHNFEKTRIYSNSSEDSENSLNSIEEIKPKQKTKFSVNYDTKYYDNKKDNYVDDRLNEVEVKEVFTSKIFDNTDEEFPGENSLIEEYSEDIYYPEEDTDECIHSKTIRFNKENCCRSNSKSERKKCSNHKKVEAKLSETKKPRLRSIEEGEEYEYKHSPNYDWDEEEKLNKREIRMNRGMEIKPIRTGDADRYDVSSKTLEFSKVDNNEKPVSERRFGKLTMSPKSEKTESKKDKRKLMGEVDLDYSDKSTPIQMVNDGSGYKFKRKEYVSSYVKQVNNLDKDEIDDIVNNTNEIDFEEKVGTINIRANLARKRSAKLRYEEELLGKEGKFSNESNEDDFTRFLRQGKKR